MKNYEGHIGQIVVLERFGKPSTMYKVIKVNPKNFKAEDENGQVWNIPPIMLRPATALEESSWSASPAASGVTFGTVVKAVPGSFLARRGSEYPLFVVVGQRDGRYQLAPLGGAKGLRFTRIPASSFEVVEFSLAGV